MKKVLALALAAVVTAGSLAVVPVDAYTDSSLGSKLIGRVGSSTKSVTKGSEFELEVRKGTKVKDNNIKWTIANTSVVKFDDDDRYDDEIELKAVGTGTTKVTANNLLTGGKIAYTVTVKNAKTGIFRIGNATKTINVGDSLDLEVRKVGLKESQIKWSVGNTSLLRFEDGDTSGDDVELVAKKAGTTKVYAKNLVSGKSVVYTVKVKATPNGIFRIGNATKTVEVGDDLDLEVRKVGLKESQIKWSVGNTSLLRFEDGDKTGSEVELEALKKGTTKVYAKNLVSGKSVVYTVKIVPDYDD